MAVAKTALLIIDVQNDFCEGGALAVPEANTIIPVINALRERVDFDCVAVTQDWHPSGHVSFFESHSGNPDAALFAPLKLEDGSEQVMWPTHCAQGSKGAEFHPGIHLKETDLIVQKGTSLDTDSYSGFFDNRSASQTKLDGLLRERGIEAVVCVGLAYDFCVGSTAIDAAKLGYRVFVAEDATRAVADTSKNLMIDRLKQAGVHIGVTADLKKDASF